MRVVCLLARRSLTIGSSDFTRIFPGPRFSFNGFACQTGTGSLVNKDSDRCSVKIKGTLTCTRNVLFCDLASEASPIIRGFAQTLMKVYCVSCKIYMPFLMKYIRIGQPHFERIFVRISVVRKSIHDTASQLPWKQCKINAFIHYPAIFQFVRHFSTITYPKYGLRHYKTNTAPNFIC